MASTYWFHGTLSPERLSRFRIDQAVGVDQRWGINVHGPVWNVKGVQIDDGAPFMDLWREVVDLSRLILACYCAMTGDALQVDVESWIEAKDAQPGVSVSGSIVEGEIEVDQDATDKLMAAMTDVVKVNELQSIDWRFALYDLHSAHADQGDEWTMYAYRAVEDCARAAGGTDKRDWAALQALMGTDEASLKARFQALKAARDAIGHGDRRDPALVHARDANNRSTMLMDLAAFVREAISRAWNATHTAA